MYATLGLFTDYRVRYLVLCQNSALGPVANTDTKLLIYGLFQKGRVLAQDGGHGRVRGARVQKRLLTSSWNRGS